MPSGFRVICADPPWKFRDGLPGKTRGAARQYPCLSVEALECFPLPPLAADCLLLMWRCASMQVEALRVMKAWGFTLKSEIVWLKLTEDTGSPRKLHFGMGRYVRASHEVCLIGVHGRVQVADRSVRSVFAAGVQEHSRKPDEIYAIAERLVPGGPYVEMFARRARAGWTVLGNEVQRAPVIELSKLATSPPSVVGRELSRFRWHELRRFVRVRASGIRESYVRVRCECGTERDMSVSQFEQHRSLGCNACKLRGIRANGVESDYAR